MFSRNSLDLLQILNPVKQNEYPSKTYWILAAFPSEVSSRKRCLYSGHVLKSLSPYLFPLPSQSSSNFILYQLVAISRLPSR